MFYNRNLLLDNLEKIHTTPLGAERIKTNLGINSDDVVAYCKSLMLSGHSQIYRQGKNWYCENCGIKITVNAGSYTIITAHKCETPL